MDQVRTKIGDVKDAVEKQERQNKQVLQRINDKKKELEERSKRIG